MAENNPTPTLEDMKAFVIQSKEFAKYVLDNRRSPKKVKEAYDKYMEGNRFFNATEIINIMPDMGDGVNDYLNLPISLEQLVITPTINPVKLEFARKKFLKSLHSLEYEAPNFSVKVSDIIQEILHIFSGLNKNKREMLTRYVMIGKHLQSLKISLTGPKRGQLFKKAIIDSDIPHDVSYCNFLIKFFNLVNVNQYVLTSNLCISFFKTNMKYMPTICADYNFTTQVENADRELQAGLPVE